MILFQLQCIFLILFCTSFIPQLLFAQSQHETQPLAFLTTETTYHPNPQDTIDFLGGFDSKLQGSELLVDVRNRLFTAAQKWVSSMQFEKAEMMKSTADYRRMHTMSTDPSSSSSSQPSSTSSVSSDSPATEFPYWRFVPQYMASVRPDGVPVMWKAACFQDSSVTMTTNDNGETYVLDFKLGNPSSLFCSDWYLLADLEGVMTQSFFFQGQNSVKWTVASNATEAEKFDIQTNGIRIFLFQDDELTTMSELTTTIGLFDPLSTQAPSSSAAEANLDFMAKYPQFKMDSRPIQDVPLNKSTIRSGDFFGILRLDGLDPMLAWAMGATIGHVTTALWIGGELYIIESTTKSSYWPVDGIQKTQYDIWIKQAVDAGYQVVYGPLTDEAAEKFDAAAALTFFQSVEGYSYGYNTMLWAWVDTPTDNFPCLPPDYTVCLTPSHMQVLFGWIDRTMPTVGDVIFLQAWNKRVGAEGLSFAEVLQKANQTGISLEELPTIVEEDSWVYNITRYGEPAVGPSLVCCTFVCNIWKHGGLFGDLADEINCAEQTNFDVYSMQVLQIPQSRPAACVNADPTNFLCQLEGKYELTLYNYSTRPLYAHMSERCPSEAPGYERPKNC
jgi:hypothetical protein